MRSFKLPLWTLMVAVILVGLGFAALRNPTELVASAVFTLTVGFLCVAVLIAIATTGRKRLVWSTFAILGSMYLSFAFGLVGTTNGFQAPPLLPINYLTTGLHRLETYTRTEIKGKAGYSYHVGSNKFEIFHPIGYYSGQKPPISLDLSQTLFIQIGQSLAALLIGFLASLVTLLVTAFRREPAKG